MYWQERETESGESISHDVVDVAYTISCESLPVDHAYALWQALSETLPWIEQEVGAGVHPMHVADTGNGWVRPNRPNDLLYLSHRTKLILRIPRMRLDEALDLKGRTLSIDGHQMSIKKATVRSLSPFPTLFARYIAMEIMSDESSFLAHAMNDLKTYRIEPRKMLCGIERAIRMQHTNMRTRSLMVADLTTVESIRLQQVGLGPLRHLGCGLFVPHKDISRVALSRD